MESLISCALEAVHRKKMTVAEAARTFGIPPSTLYARVNGRSSKRGRPCYFTIEQEANLEELIVSCANSGIALSPRILHKVVMNAAIRQGMLCCKLYSYIQCMYTYLQELSAQDLATDGWKSSRSGIHAFQNENPPPRRSHGCATQKRNYKSGVSSWIKQTAWDI